MTIQYTPTPVFGATVTLPKDGDAANEEAFVGIQEVADRTQQLKGRNDSQEAANAAQDATIAGHTAALNSLSDAAHKSQANTFTQQQTITVGSGDALFLHGHLWCDSGSLEAGNGHVKAGLDVEVNTGEFKYKALRTRTVSINVASGCGTGQMSNFTGGAAGGLEGTNAFLTVGQHLTYPLLVPHGAKLKEVRTKLNSSAGAATYVTQIRWVTGFHFDQTNNTPGSGIPWYGTLDALSGSYNGVKNVINILGAGAGVVTSSEDTYSLLVVAQSGTVIISAIQFTYEEQFLRTYGSR